MESCYDAIGIFLCIHINFRYQAIMQRRSVTCLEMSVHDTYLYWVYNYMHSYKIAVVYLVTVEFLLCRFSDHLLAVMWPRFHHVVELNVNSVRDCNTQKLGTIDTRPHYVSSEVVCVLFY